MFGWGYPPGVTGDEFEIAGPDWEKDTDVECECGWSGVATVIGYKWQRWFDCPACGRTTTWDDEA